MFCSHTHIHIHINYGHFFIENCTIFIIIIIINITYIKHEPTKPNWFKLNRIEKLSPSCKKKNNVRLRLFLSVLVCVFRNILHTHIIFFILIYTQEAPSMLFWCVFPRKLSCFLVSNKKKRDRQTDRQKVNRYCEFFFFY